MNRLYRDFGFTQYELEVVKPHVACSKRTDWAFIRFMSLALAIFLITLLIHVFAEPRQVQAADMQDASWEVLGCNAWRAGSAEVQGTGQTNEQLDKHCKRFGV